MNHRRHTRSSTAGDRDALALSWSGGKDSALALWTLREAGRPPELLLTTVTETYDRISIHGVRRELLARQAAAVGLPLIEVPIPADATNGVYEARMRQALARTELTNTATIVFGDLFLGDVRAYREAQLATSGKRALFPLWGADTAALARRFVAAGFRAIVVCVDPSRLDACFAGRSYDSTLLDDLPPEVDPCGENGEFHTFVHAGPIFSRPIACAVGAVVRRGDFVFCDVTPA